MNLSRILTAATCLTACLTLTAETQVKIRVEQNGIYALTHEQLRSLGFDHPEQVRVYGVEPSRLTSLDLNALPAELPQMASRHTADRLLFYAEGPVTYSVTVNDEGQPEFSRTRNPYSLSGYYFLSDADRGSNPLSVVTDAAPAEVPAQWGLAFHEEELDNPSESGAYFYGRNLGATESEDITLPMADAASSRRMRLFWDSCVGFRTGASGVTSGYNRLYVAFPEEIEVTDNVDDGASGYRQYRVCDLSHSSRTLTLPAEWDSPELTLRVCVHPLRQETIEYIALDYMALLYERSDSYTPLPGGADVWCPVPFRTEGVEKWNVSTSTTDALQHLIAFDPDGEQLEPEVLTAVETSQEIASTDAQMVIITTSTFVPQAQELARLHRELSGEEVAVVEQWQVFDRYSSGTPCPMGVRRFLADLYSRSEGRLQAVLMYGTGTNRQHRQLTSDESIHVISYHNQDRADAGWVTRSYCSDAFFGILHNPSASGTITSSALMKEDMDIAVGRLPISSAADATAYNNKVCDYLSHPPTEPLINNALFVSDWAKANEDCHLWDSERVLAAMNAPAGLTATRVSMQLMGVNTAAKAGPKAKPMLHSALQRGTGLVTYFGHASNTVWGMQYQLFTEPDSRSVSSPGIYPFMMLGTCHSATFDQEQSGIFTQLLFKPNGGVIAMVSAGRQVLQHLNEELGEEVAAAYASEPDGITFGRIFSRARHETMLRQPIYTSNQANTHCYNLLGDPLLPRYAASHSVTFDAEEFALNSGSVNTISGRILTPDGEVDTDFNGTVRLALYDYPYTASNPYATTDGAEEGHAETAFVTIDQEMLTELTGSVTSGRFTVSGYVPAPLRSGSTPCRLTAYAFTSDGSTRASGGVGSVTYTIADADLPEADEPQITEFYVNTPDYGGEILTTNRNVRICASVTAPAGLKTGAMLSTGGGFRLLHNGRTVPEVANFVRLTAPGQYQLTYDFSELSDGMHTVHLTAVDALNRVDTSELTFRVLTQADCTLTLTAIADRQLTFELTHPLEADAEAILVLEDVQGHTVLTSTDLTLDAAELPSGHYKAHARLQSASAHASTPRIDIVL